MIKKIATGLLCVALGSTLYARDIEESDLFIGLELDATKVDSSVNALGVVFPAPTSDTVMEYGVRLGAEKNEWRTTFLYTYYNNSENGDEETMHKGALLLDYFLWDSGQGDFSVKPYIGAHVGYMSYELTGQMSGSPLTVQIVDDSGVYYGAQAGVSMRVAASLGLDLSYRYSLTTMDEMSVTGYDPAVANISLDHMGSIAFSINYFY